MEYKYPHEGLTSTCISSCLLNASSAFGADLDDSDVLYNHFQLFIAVYSQMKTIRRSPSETHQSLFCRFVIRFSFFPLWFGALTHELLRRSAPEPEPSRRPEHGYRFLLKDVSAVALPRITGCCLNKAPLLSADPHEAATSSVLILPFT